MEQISILIVDDHAVVRHGLRSLLQEQPGWKIVGEAANGREAVQKAGELHPDVVVLDISMPGLNGLDTAPLLLAASPNSRVIVLTMHCTEEFIDIVANTGAHGYVLKSEAEDVVITAIRKVLSGEKFFSPAVPHSLLAQQHDDRRRRKGHLTMRETQIVQLLAEGKSNKEVSVHLNLSVRTVENHRARIMQKLHLNSFSDLVRHAIRNKLVEA
ncbi:MAG: DNA-binding response regulator [Candidatus Angelobacter sp. Gp1-AA117]|nr:MAG: DNA-binding response regulator [Candidatus Angelobacter sp. Gp1-AA117]